MQLPLPISSALGFPPDLPRPSDTVADILRGIRGESDSGMLGLREDGGKGPDGKDTMLRKGKWTVSARR
jgi:hypothetical protein